MNAYDFTLQYTSILQGLDEFSSLKHFIKHLVGTIHQAFNLNSFHIQSLPKSMGIANIARNTHREFMGMHFNQQK